MSQNTKAILSRLVACHSVELLGVQAMFKEVEKIIFQNDRLKVRRIISLNGGRVWRIPGRKSLSPLVLSGHVDTVRPSAQWSSDPYRMRLHRGRMVGLGVSDMKGSIAAWLAAVASLRGRFAQDTYIILSGDEETAGRGTPQLLAKLKLRHARIIVGEPTRNRIRIGQKGCVDLEVAVRGKAIHAGRTTRAYNARWSAIHRMRRVLEALATYERRIEARRDPLMGTPSLCIGTIAGGTSTNSVADRCAITLSRRTVPREGSVAGVARELTQVVRGADSTATVRQLFCGEAWSTNREDPWVRTVQKFLRGAGEGGATYVDAPWTEAAYLSKIGAVVVCGPGIPEQAHRPDESIEFSALERGTGFIAALCRNPV